MTPPHIEAIARAMEPEAFSNWQRMYDLWAETWTEEDAKRIADRQYGAAIQTAIDQATIAFSMSAEICAKEVEALASKMEKTIRKASQTDNIVLYARAKNVLRGARECAHRIRALAVEG